MGITKQKRILLIALGVLIVWQVGTYLLFASSSITRIAPHLTPEHTHFVRGTTFSWVWLKTDQCQNLTATQLTDLRSLFTRRYDRVYGDEADIPERRISRDPSGNWLKYEDGFAFNFGVVSRGPFWVRVSHADKVGNMAASLGEHVYVWVLGFWVWVYDGPQYVS